MYLENIRLEKLRKKNFVEIPCFPTVGNDAVSVVDGGGIDRADDRPLLGLRRTELNSDVSAGIPKPRGAPEMTIVFQCICLSNYFVLAKTLGGFTR